MRLEKASAKAIKYACMTFHYAKAVPVNTFGFSVFNDANEWCGVVLYGTGASINISKPYNLSQGQVVELVRMALNGKHGITTAVLSLSLRLLRKSVPNVKLVISYADSEQGHNGTIYQASNWFYTGSITDSCFLIDGKMTHRRSAYSKYGTSSLDKIKANNKQVVRVNSKPKYKYIYPIDKTLVPLCKSLAKPYPKSNAAIVQGSISGFQSEDGSRTDLAAQTGNNGIQH